jgi:hypothetical protein
MLKEIHPRRYNSNTKTKVPLAPNPNLSLTDPTQRMHLPSYKKQRLPEFLPKNHFQEEGFTLSTRVATDEASVNQ